MSECFDDCTFGRLLEEKCHLLDYTRVSGLIRVFEMSPERVQVLCLRAGFEVDDQMNICHHHEQTLLVQFGHLQKKCCDPFSLHKRTVKSSLREISLDAVKSFKSLGIDVIPGKKLCPSCRVQLSRKLDIEKNNAIEMSDNEDTSPAEFEADYDSEKTRESLDSSFSELEVSPLKSLHAVASHTKALYGKRKIQQVQDAMQQKVKGIKSQVADMMNVPPEQLKITVDSETESLSAQTKQKAEDLDRLVDLMKEKLKISPREKKVQILTMAPPSWSIARIKEEFNVSSYLVGKARKLRAEKGILELPDKNRGKPLDKEVEDLVKSFYCDDEYSRQMPGKKDFVSIKKNVHMQKRLLLCDLKELYAVFKDKNPDVKIGFSKFCSLRPKWCILVGSSGTHSVCVCTIHQNVALMLNAVDIPKDYHELIDMMVCSRDNKQCMIHRCKDCPDQEKVKQYLESVLCDENLEEEEEEAEVVFRQWTSTDRADLVVQTLLLSEFISKLIEKLNMLTAHSYITKAQGKYIKDVKENLKENCVLVLGDFAENYKFVIQDEVQSYHWNQQSCTLHPIVIYSKKDGNLKEHSLCFISDDLNHDTSFVYQVMKLTIEFIKENISSHVTEVHYFSDGCAGQYKNCKNFINLCLHEHDFGIKCKWSFFATSHGKSPCDGLGGTLKRLTARASLQRPHTEQIISARQVFDYCSKEVKGIEVFFITNIDMEILRRQLQQRYSTVHTLPGTRSFHHFTPLSLSVMAAKRVSADNDAEIEFDLVMGKRIDRQQQAEVKVADFILCCYDEEFWIGLVDEIDEENQDVRVNFMHPCFPARSFSWPRRVDTCYVPSSHILCAITAPCTATGRQYKLSTEQMQAIQNEIQKYNTFKRIV